MQLKKVISGGQTGADQAGLYAARDSLIKTGGWAPKNWITKNGAQPDLLISFGLVEHQSGYKARTFANVRDSDGTIRLAYNFKSPGEICTLNAIIQYKKPKLDINIPIKEKPNIVLDFINRYSISVLNIAGNTQPEKGIDVFNICYNFLMSSFELINNNREIS